MRGVCESVHATLGRHIRLVEGVINDVYLVCARIINA
jgi:hypothetical protein